MKNLATWTLVSGISFAILACETSTTPGDLADPETPRGIWELQSFETSSGLTPVSDPAKYTLELNEDGGAQVVADCNLCSGSYEIDGGSLSLGVMACTLAACLPGSLHDDFLEALGSVSAWQRSGNELQLAYADGTLRFQTP